MTIPQLIKRRIQDSSAMAAGRWSAKSATVGQQRSLAVGRRRSVTVGRRMGGRFFIFHVVPDEPPSNSIAHEGQNARDLFYVSCRS